MSRTFTHNGNDFHLKTNNVPRDLVSFVELPEDAREEFDYAAPEDAYNYRFFKYRGSWYDYYEFERATGLTETLGFHGVQTESYFSAVVIKYVENDDQVIVGYLHW